MVGRLNLLPLAPRLSLDLRRVRDARKTNQMTGTRPSDSWDAGDPYEQYVGRWSHLAAYEFLAWLNLPPSLRWLEVGCGTGALTAAISERCQPARLIGIDPSEGFLAKARVRLGNKATFRVANALDLPVQDAEADVVRPDALASAPAPSYATGRAGTPLHRGGRWHGLPVNSMR